MKHFVLPEHKHFFQKEGYLEYEALLCPEKTLILNALHEKALQKRLPRPFTEYSSGALFKAGRDLWHEDPLLKKKTLSKEFAELTSSLTNESSFRIGFSHFLRTSSREDLERPLSEFSLSKMSSFQGILSGLIIRLKEGKDVGDLLPKNPGSALFFKPSLSIPLSSLWNSPSESFLVIAYTNKKSVYILQKEDPHTHDLKRRGYVFGDVLNESSHPLVLS